MSFPNDTDPPPPAPETAPVLPDCPDNVCELPILAGSAQHSVAAAVANLVGAVTTIERLSMALARALDEHLADTRTR